jgi:hypothetical protein
MPHVTSMQVSVILKLSIYLNCETTPFNFIFLKKINSMVAYRRWSRSYPTIARGDGHVRGVITPPSSATLTLKKNLMRFHTESKLVISK